jgi:phosphoserine phosphatase RsbU/P
MSLQENLLLAIAGSSILTIGLLALWAHFASALSRDRILLWFGLFVAPYGGALLSRTLILSGPDQQSALWIAILGRMVGLGAIVPALLLFRGFYGNGWRFSSGFLLWIYVVLSAGVVILATVEERPRSIPSPGLILIILVPFLLAVDRFAGYRPPAMPHRSVIYTGLVIFFLAFSYDHLAHWRAHSMTTSSEPIAFMVLVVCLGYVVSQRVAIAEAEWRTMGDEMRVARRIQAAILPASMPTVSGYSIAARYSPMTAVAGDFYCFPSQKPDDFAIVLADVMGHGVPAALVASMIKVAVYAGIENGTSPAQTVTHLNSTLCKQAPGLGLSLLRGVNDFHDVGRIVDHALSHQEPRGKLVVVAGRAHRHRDRLRGPRMPWPVRQPDLERLLSGYRFAGASHFLARHLVGARVNDRASRLTHIAPASCEPNEFHGLSTLSRPRPSLPGQGPP